jgi:Pin2-interacting protein X1
MTSSSTSSSTQNKAWAESSTNIGKRLLSSMGWKDGDGLGKNKQGQTNAVKLKKRSEGEVSGLGFSSSSSSTTGTITATTTKGSTISSIDNNNSDNKLLSILSQLKSVHANTTELDTSNDNDNNNIDNNNDTIPKKHKSKKLKKSPTSTNTNDDNDPPTIIESRKKRYRKFHESKDISRYSANQLDAIFGRPPSSEPTINE